MYTYRCCRCRPAVQEIQKDRDLHEGLAIQDYHNNHNQNHHYHNHHRLHQVCPDSYLTPTLIMFLDNLERSSSEKIWSLQLPRPLMHR